MTTDQFNQKLNDKMAEIVKTNKPLMLAVQSIMSVQSKRIFTDAKNVAGTEIGKYVGGEIYVSPKTNKGLGAFPLKGKVGKTKYKNGESHKTGYFTNYLAFKKALGKNKNVNTVDLKLTGELHRDWANGNANFAKAKRINQHQYNVSLKQNNANKAERYGNVFGLSAKEKADFLKVIQGELTKAMK